MKTRFGPSLICAVLCAVFCVASAAAQTAPAATSTKPNFTGTWKMNPAKSKFERGGPDAITIKLDHKDNNLNEALTISNSGNERTMEGKYITDGKESEIQMGGDTAKATVKWEGDALVIEWKAVEGRFFRRKLTLSPDGKTLTLNVTQGQGDGSQAEDVVVLEKQ